MAGASKLWREFKDVDANDDPGSLGRYLDDVASVRSVEGAKHRSLELLGLSEGSAVLDVGCGTGRELSELARIVGRPGRVVGLDSSAALIAHAAASCNDTDPAAIELVVGDGHELPFADDAFDGCRADRTLQHLAQPDRALREMVRVIRPGGRVVVTEGGWALKAPTLDRALTNRVLSVVLTAEADRHWVGYLLPVMFRMAGLADVHAASEHHAIREFDELSQLLNLDRVLPESVASGRVPRDEAEDWLEGLRGAVRDREAHLEVDMMHLAGVKPRA